MTLKEFLAKSLKESAKMYMEDLRAMPDEVLLASPGGVARSPVDYSHEIAVINRRIAIRLRGEDPGAWPGPEKGFIRAPADMSAQEVVESVQESFDAVVAAFDAFDERELETEIVLPQGKTSALDLASLAIVHSAYHDGQLNYAQTMAGDEEVHWDFD